MLDIFKTTKIQHKIKDCVETGIIVQGTNSVGGTFDVTIICDNNVYHNTLFRIIPKMIDLLDHSTISDDKMLSHINERYFVLNINEAMRDLNINFISPEIIFGLTLISILNIENIIGCIESVEITLNKQSVIFSEKLHNINYVSDYESN